MELGLEKFRVLVLGASGMLGSAVFKFFLADDGLDVYGTLRSSRFVRYFGDEARDRLIVGIDVENTDGLLTLFAKLRPDVVVNCIGLVKQLADADDPLLAIPINSMLPHRLARMCALIDARLVHLSTDCVFSGKKGKYLESDLADATDLYGRSKLMGEVDYPNAITLRTSIIGHELDGARSLIGWFLAQQKKVRGFRRAIFSGLPTVEIARVLKNHVFPNPQLHGLYHLSAEPINKYELLSLVALLYGKSIEIEPDDGFVIDRSLNSERFREATGFAPSDWPDLVISMRDFGKEGLLNV